MESADLKTTLRLVAESELASLRNITVKTLRNERYTGGGPPYVVMGNEVFYPLDKLKKFISQESVTPKRPRTLVNSTAKRPAT